MGGNTESVLKPGIKFRLASGSLRRPHTVPDCSATKNRLSHFSGRFEPRSFHRHTDWVPGRLRHHQQAPPAAAPPAAAPPPPPARQRPRRRHDMWVRPWLLQREERGAYHNIMAELYATDIPGFTNLMRMTPEFFEMIKTRLEPRLARQATNYRAPISVGEKLALTIRYLATGESYTSLSCQFRVGRSTISKFLPESAGPSRMSSPEST